jgi:ankyrin repeat protein
MSRFLERSTVDINCHDNNRETPLILAAKNGHIGAVGLLLRYKADANAQGGIYGRALQAAAAHGHGSIVEMLLNNGADVDAQSGYYATALYAAVDKGYDNIVVILLSKGANINAQSKTQLKHIKATIERIFSSKIIERTKQLMMDMETNKESDFTLTVESKTPDLTSGIAFPQSTLSHGNIEQSDDE